MAEQRMTIEVGWQIADRLVAWEKQDKNPYDVAAAILVGLECYARGSEWPWEMRFRCCRLALLDGIVWGFKPHPPERTQPPAAKELHITLGSVTGSSWSDARTMGSPAQRAEMTTRPIPNGWSELREQVERDPTSVLDVS